MSRKKTAAAKPANSEMGFETEDALRPDPGERLERGAAPGGEFSGAYVVPDSTGRSVSNLCLLEPHELLEMQPTDPQSIANQCDAVAELCDRSVDQAALIRAMFMHRRGLSPVVLHEKVDQLTAAATRLVRLINSLKTHMHG